MRAYTKDMTDKKALKRTKRAVKAIQEPAKGSPMDRLNKALRKIVSVPKDKLQK
jgi:hypothetical protein